MLSCMSYGLMNENLNIVGELVNIGYKKEGLCRT